MASNEIKSEVDEGEAGEGEAPPAKRPRSSRVQKNKTPEISAVSAPTSNTPSLEQQEEDENCDENGDENEDDEMDDELDEEDDYEEEEERSSKKSKGKKKSPAKSKNSANNTLNSSGNRSASHRLPTCPYEKGTFVLRLLDLSEHEQARKESIWKVDSAQLLLRYNRKSEADNTTYVRTQNYTAWAMAPDDSYIRLEVVNLTKADEETVVVKYPSQDEIDEAKKNDTGGT